MLNGTEIKRVPKSKSLGVIIDESLTWDEQFKAVKSKVCGGLSALKKLKNIIPQSQLCSVFHAIVESHLRYAEVIWGSLSKTKLDTLQRLHNRAHAIIENARIKDEWSSNWLRVENLIRFDRSVMAYKREEEQAVYQRKNKQSTRGRKGFYQRKKEQSTR